jgi:hypothetical protein
MGLTSFASGARWPRRRHGAALIALGVGVGSLAQAAPRSSGSLLFGPTDPVTAAPPAIDPRLPVGALALSAPPPTADAALCSPRFALCVNATGQAAARLPAALATLESAYRELTAVLHLPHMHAGFASTPVRGFSVYLQEDWTGPAAAFVDRALALHDRATSYCVVNGKQADVNAMIQCLAQAAANWMDAAETPATKLAYATHVSFQTGHAGAHELAAVDDVQANPQAGLLTREASPLAAAGSMLLSALDAKWRHPQPTWLASALFSLSRGTTPSGGLFWHNEPDLFDVVRTSLGDGTQPSADWLGHFALQRALAGLDPAHSEWPELRATGALARVRFDWRLAFSSLPRRVTITRPLEPLGTTYLWLDIDTPAADRTLGFHAQWERPVAFKWMMLGLDAQGNEVARLDVPFVENANTAERTWVNLGSVQSIVIAGSNLGAIDAAHPFDPDQGPWEPHGLTVYLAAL